MPTILLVEDESSLLVRIADNLRRGGYRVLTAVDGEAALVVLIDAFSSRCSDTGHLQIDSLRAFIRHAIDLRLFPLQQILRGQDRLKLRQWR